MERNRWQRLQGLFLELLEVEPSVRFRRLEETTLGDQDLRRELSEMLRAHEDESQLRIEQHILTVQRDAVGGLEGQRIGAYEVRREIGYGGMGTVYLAERVDGYRQVVALKVMKAGIGGPELEERFRRERQILARLDHPNIAQILGGGVTDQGRPYLVMPYVQGLPVTAYCEEGRVGLSERLELFCSVCEAVDQAHRSLIVHRDLKPSNILVTGDGEVRLLDFGIAKLLRPDATGSEEPPPGANHTELRLLTPEHASPEQILDRPVTTATDTWALGVLLYELLVGARPFSAEGRNRLQLESAICEDDPPPPSAAIRRLGPGPGRDLRRGWSRLLVGDLDAIVRLALQKEPEERYGSVEQLADDIRRSLAREPVRARSGTFLYRSGRFVRRNAWQTALALAFLLLLAVFAVTSALQSRALEIERDRVRRERDTADQVTQVLIDLFETTDPESLPGGRALTVEDLLNLRTERVLGGLEGRTAVQVRLRHILGTVYRAHSRFDESRRLLREALRQQLDVAGWHDGETLEIYHELATLEAVSGRRGHGRRMLRHSLDLHRAVLGSGHEKIAVCLVDLAGSLPSADEERSRLLQEALELRRAFEPVAGIGTASTLNALGLAKLEENRLEEALELFRRSGAIVDRLLGEDHPHSLTVQANMAVVLTQLNRVEESKATKERLLSASREIYGPESFDVANALNNLGSSLAASNRWPEAERAFRESLALARRLLQPPHPKLDNTVRNLAYVVEFQGRADEALALLEGIDREDRIADPTGRLRTEAQIAALHLHAGQADAAVTSLEGLVERLEASGAAHGESVFSLAERYLGEAYLVVGRYREAERTFRQTLGPTLETYGPEHPISAHVSCGLASALAGQGRREEARVLFRACLPVFSAWGWAHPVAVATYQGFAAGLPDPRTEPSPPSNLREPRARTKEG